jgi:hypothetical protein
MVLSQIWVAIRAGKFYRNPREVEKRFIVYQIPAPSALFESSSRNRLPDGEDNEINLESIPNIKQEELESFKNLLQNIEQQPFFFPGWKVFITTKFFCIFIAHSF